MKRDSDLWKKGCAANEVMPSLYSVICILGKKDAPSQDQNRLEAGLFNFVMQFCRCSEKEAKDCSITLIKKGSVALGTYMKDVAETKIAEAYSEELNPNTLGVSLFLSKK